MTQRILIRQLQKILATELAPKTSKLKTTWHSPGQYNLFISRLAPEKQTGTQPHFQGGRPAPGDENEPSQDLGF